MAATDYSCESKHRLWRQKNSPFSITALLCTLKKHRFPLISIYYVIKFSKLKDLIKLMLLKIISWIHV